MRRCWSCIGGCWRRGARGSKSLCGMGGGGAGLGRMVMVGSWVTHGWGTRLVCMDIARAGEGRAGLNCDTL
jgi:hypothetical protein